MVRRLVSLYTIVILVLPIGLAGLPILYCENLLLRVVALFCAPLVFAFSFLLTCGLLSRPHRWAIREGRFVRSLDDPVYGRRRLHAMCWTSVYYSPLYSLYLSVGWLRTLLFRLFGYSGSLQFTVYPDTWIRDLPLLKVGAGAYLSNKATIGTNLALRDGRILVEGITIGRGAMVGHLTMVAAGSRLAESAEVSHGTACGARVTVGKSCLIQPCSTIDHMADIGDGCAVGTISYIGVAAKIGPGLKIPPGAAIPRRAKLLTQNDVDDYISSETRDLQRLRRQLAEQLAAGLQDEQ